MILPVDIFEVTEKMAEAVTSLDGGRAVSCEASDLGLHAFPRMLEFEGLRYSHPKALVDREGETYAIEYRTSEGCTFTLWND